MRPVRALFLCAASLLAACSLVVGISDIVPADGGGDGGRRREGGAVGDAAHDRSVPRDARSTHDAKDGGLPGDSGDASPSGGGQNAACDAGLPDAHLLVTLACHLNHPSAIAVGGGYVFWGDDDAGLGVLADGGGLRRHPDYGPVSEIATNDVSVFWIAESTGHGAALDGAQQSSAVTPPPLATHVGASGVLVCWTAADHADLNFGLEEDGGKMNAGSGGRVTDASATGIAVEGSPPTAFMTTQPIGHGLPTVQLYYTGTTPFDTACDVQLAATALPGPIVVAGSRAFWLDEGAATETIQSLPSTPSLCSAAASTFVSNASGSTLAATATMLYWSMDGGIMRAAVDAGTGAPLVYISGLPASPQRIAVDGKGWIYWTEGTAPGGGAIRRAHE